MSRKRLSTVVANRPLCFWSRMDVEEWLKRRLPKLYNRYGKLFIDHNITGRVLVEITDRCLDELGVDNWDDRQELLLEITRTKLRYDYDELSNMYQVVRL